MAYLRPFKATLPKAELASDVPTRSFLTYDREKRKKILASNPNSFLHVLFPGYDSGVRLRGADRFEAIRAKFLEFVENGVFERSEKDAMYLYAIDIRNFHFCGLICGVSAADYEAEVILKHEDTIRKRVDLFTEYLETVRFNAEPVLLMHRDLPEWDTLVSHIKAGQPSLDVHYENGERHRLWTISNADILKQIQNIFDRVPEIYIADGHHRSASSAQLSRNFAEKNVAHNGKEAYNDFMGFLIPEQDIIIHEFNRAVVDLNGLSPVEFLEIVGEHFKVEEIDYPRSQKKKYHFGMYLDGRWYRIEYVPTEAERNDPLENLDAEILYRKIIKPILGIEDLRSDTRIQYLFGAENLEHMQQRVDAGEFAVGFGLSPTGVDEMMAIADAGKVMPPKSTYIEPKLLSGLVIYEY